MLPILCVPISWQTNNNVESKQTRNFHPRYRISPLIAFVRGMNDGRATFHLVTIERWQRWRWWQCCEVHYYLEWKDVERSAIRVSCYHFFFIIQFHAHTHPFGLRVTHANLLGFRCDFFFPLSISLSSSALIQLDTFRMQAVQSATHIAREELVSIRISHAWKKVAWMRGYERRHMAVDRCAA